MVLFFTFQNSKESLIASSDVVGCDVTGSRSIFNCDSGGGRADGGSELVRPSSTSAAANDGEAGGGGGGGDGQQRETHSCPSSPTETDCSSGFSTLRRRSVTLTEKVIRLLSLLTHVVHMTFPRSSDC